MRIGEYPHQTELPLESIQSRLDPAYRTGGAERSAAVEPTEEQVLRHLGFGKPVIARMAERAARNGTTVEQELLSDGWVDEHAYYAALARALDLPYVGAIDPRQVADHEGLDTQLLQPTTLRIQHSRHAPLTVIVPNAGRIPDFRATLARLPDLRQSLVVSSPSSLRKAVWAAGAERRVRQTVNALFEWQPRFSARIVFWGRQGFYTGFAAASLAALFILAPAETIDGSHLLLSLLYCAALFLRLFALVHQRRPAKPIAPLPDDHHLPVYTIIVAVYREEAIIGQLLATLKRIHWPTSRLDIKLVCEADDHGTIAAIRALKPGPCFEIVEVPVMHPRTKPKALSYALPAARGEYLAIYDAEDRPHPDQLREAYGRFRAAPADIACLQAPLIITNARSSWISALFSLEYSALFRGLLPMLARHRMPLPLGGTSNHFRTDILRAAGGWDPFNVTEDADLGMRLYRLGYRSDVIQRQTLEDAPTTLSVWTGQRTRWFKGWLQTWLLLMRDPGQVRREMGSRAFAVFHLLIGGMLISSLAHPFILVFPLLTVVSMLQSPAESLTVLETALFAIDFINVIGSYATFLALGATSMIEHEKRMVGWRWTAVPVYWMMVSFAAWRAVFELRSNPFFWHKTPHVPTGSVSVATAGQP